MAGSGLPAAVLPSPTSATTPPSSTPAGLRAAELCAAYPERAGATTLAVGRAFEMTSAEGIGFQRPLYHAVLGDR